MLSKIQLNEYVFELKDMDTKVLKMESIFGKNMDIGMKIHDNKSLFPNHCHDFIEIVYMLQGNIEHVVEGKSYCLEQGDTLIIREGIYHEISTINLEAIMVNLLVSKPFLIQCINSNSTDIYFTRAIYYIINGNTSSLKIKTNSENNLNSIVKDIISCLKIDQKISNVLLKAHFVLFISNLIVNSNFIIPENFKNDSVFLIRFEEYINNHENCSLQEFSNIINYSTSYTSKKIKKIYNCSFTEIIQDKKLQKACVLLVNTELSISKVAHISGYENITFFNEVFIRKFKVSPKQYRKNIH